MCTAGQQLLVSLFISYEKSHDFSHIITRLGDKHFLAHIISSLPPTETAFSENDLYGHREVVIWWICLKTNLPVLAPTENEWYQPEVSTTPFPIVLSSDIPLAPADALKVIKCDCSSE